MAGLRPLIRDISVLVADLRSPEARSARLASFAREKIAEAAAINRSVSGRDVPHEVAVDGRVNVSLESVKPDGLIVANFDLVFGVLEWIGAELLRASPHRTGRYQDSHRLFLDGVEHQVGAPIKVDFEEAVFVNVQPYARKIERGLSSQAPDGVYHGVAAVAKTRFGNTAAVKFSYRSLQEGGLVAYRAAGRRAKKTRGEKGRFTGSQSTRSPEELAAAKVESQTRQPAIVVRPF